MTYSVLVKLVLLLKIKRKMKIYVSKNPYLQMTQLPMSSFVESVFTRTKFHFVHFRLLNGWDKQGSFCALLSLLRDCSLDPDSLLTLPWSLLYCKAALFSIELNSTEMVCLKLH